MDGWPLGGGWVDGYMYMAVYCQHGVEEET